MPGLVSILGIVVKDTTEVMLSLGSFLRAYAFLGA